MGDDKDRENASVLVLPFGKREKHADLKNPSCDDDNTAPDPLLDALRHLADDMLEEAIPERLLEAMRKKGSRNEDR